MEFDLNKRHCFFFNEISKIPHGSYNEKELSDYIVDFAKKHNLAYKQDELYNVIVYKPGSKGLEEAPALMLQAHIDMVAEKNKDCDHDFMKDPLKLVVKEGWLHAEGTTLGADDGHGVAYMLAILEDKTLVHPPLECVFTALEEVGLLGAINITTDWIKSHRMISLDGGGECSTLLSNAGGCRANVHFPVVKEANEWPTYRLEVRGLLGGHSGGNIDKERGNANVLAVRAIKELMLKKINVRLVEVQGGLKVNAIPREADIVFTTDSDEVMLNQIILATLNTYKIELEHSDSGIDLKLMQEEKAITALSLKNSTDLINLIYLLPNGFRHRSMAINGLTLTSLNLGVLSTEEKEVVLHYSLRSAIDSGIDYLLNIIQTQAELFNCSVSISSRYPGWNYKVKSSMRDTLAKVVKDSYNVELELKATHGGTECGIFSVLYPDFDIIAMGPETEHVHTPDERLNLASFDRVYKLLTTVISECK